MASTEVTVTLEDELWAILDRHESNPEMLDTLVRVYACLATVVGYDPEQIATLTQSAVDAAHRAIERSGHRLLKVEGAAKA